MKIIQLLPTIDYGDAVSNDVLTIREILVKNDVQTGIYAENIGRRISRSIVSTIDQMPHLAENDIILYHASTGTQLNYDLPKFGGRRVMIYHNITPPLFFREYSPAAMNLCENGYKGIQYLSDKVEYCIADSDYNRQELLRMGYRCPIDVCPILIPFEDYDQEPDQKVLRKYQRDGFTNLLFVGRIAPNKKQEDIIRAFYCYQKYFNPRSRLFLVGSDSGMESYRTRLEAYAQTLGIADKVIFPGHIKFNAILAYYHLADVFVCMSEHEGFCVPIVEAMHFGIPIAAYNSSAVPETLGKGGLLLEDKNPKIAAAAIDRIVKDGELRETISQQQKKQLRRYQYDNVRKTFLDCLEKFLKA